jgi:hypothetical protein
MNRQGVLLLQNDGTLESALSGVFEDRALDVTVRGSLSQPSRPDRSGQADPQDLRVYRGACPRRRFDSQRARTCRVSRPAAPQDIGRALRPSRRQPRNHAACKRATTRSRRGVMSCVSPHGEICGLARRELVQRLELSRSLRCRRREQARVGCAEQQTHTGCSTC